MLAQLIERNDGVGCGTTNDRKLHHGGNAVPHGRFQQLRIADAVPDGGIEFGARRGDCHDDYHVAELTTATAPVRRNAQSIGSSVRSAVTSD